MAVDERANHTFYALGGRGRLGPFPCECWYQRFTWSSTVIPGNPLVIGQAFNKQANNQSQEFLPFSKLCTSKPLRQWCEAKHNNAILDKDDGAGDALSINKYNCGEGELSWNQNVKQPE
jgi:hypothetical protein